MDSKERRLALIREITGTADIGSQAELRRALERRRVQVTQSTLSRDLRELNVRKVRGRYLVQDEVGDGEEQLDLSPAVLSWTSCGPHLLVLRVATGQAQAVAVRIDSKEDPAITGTLAGDDTIFLATKSKQQQIVAQRRLSRWFGDKG